MRNGMKKTVVILHHPLPKDAAPDEEDVLVQAAAVADALKSLGYYASIVPFDLNISSFGLFLKKLDPVCVFNLVESLEGDGRLIHLACSILDHLSIPYTGAGTEAMFVTSNKVLAKRWMRLAGIPTPEWIIPGIKPECDLVFPSKYIVKALWEEASIGLDEESVKEAGNISELLGHLQNRSRSLNKKCFGERFIEGRELNLSVLGGLNGAEVLPPAEIEFAFPEGREKIVDYRAKWDKDSFEYQATTRTFSFKKDDEYLLDELRRIALECWESFDLRGYARVDFRVDEQGAPFVLEINANPCISPDSGFTAAAERAGIGYPELINRIIGDTLGRERT
jgi:D-alanine-D-alanine ligase